MTEMLRCHSENPCSNISYIFYSHFLKLANVILSWKECSCHLEKLYHRKNAYATGKSFAYATLPWKECPCHLEKLCLYYHFLLCMCQDLFLLMPPSQWRNAHATWKIFPNATLYVCASQGIFTSAIFSVKDCTCQLEKIANATLSCYAYASQSLLMPPYPAILIPVREPYAYASSIWSVWVTMRLVKYLYH